MTNVYINAEAAIVLYIKPSSASAYDESAFVVHFPAHLGFVITEATPSVCTEPYASSTSNYNSRTPVCALTEDSDTGEVLLTVSNLRTTGSAISLYYLQFNGLQNGPSARKAIIDNDVQTGAYVVSFDADGDECETFYGTQFQFLHYTKTQGVYLSPSPAQNSEEGTLTIKFTVDYAIPADGSIIIYLPRQNYQYVDLGRRYATHMITSTSSMVVSASYKSSGSSTVSLGSLSYEASNDGGIDDSGERQSSIKALLENDDEIPAEAVLTVTVTKILMPPNLKPFGGNQISIITGDSDYFYIEEAIYEDLTIRTSTPGTTSSSYTSEAEITTDTGVSEEDQTYKFTVYLKGDIPQNGYFTLTVPSEVGMPSGLASDLTVECLSALSCDSIALTYTSSTREIKFAGAVSSASDYIIAPAPLVFTVRGFTNPSTADEAFFTFKSYASLDNGVYQIDEITSLGITAEQGKCTIDEFYPTDGNYMIYGLATNWTVSMKCEHFIGTNYGVRITLPEDFYVIETSTCRIGPYCWYDRFDLYYDQRHWPRDPDRYEDKYEKCKNPYRPFPDNQRPEEYEWEGEINPQYSCVGDNSERTITIRNYLKETLDADTQHQFVFNSIRNPSELRTTYEIKFETLSDTDGTVDIGYYKTLRRYQWFTKGNITLFDVIPQNYGVGQFPVFYHFRIQPSGELYRYSYLRIVLPDEIRVYDERELEKNCNYNLKGFTSTRISCKVNGNVIFINSGFNQRATTAMTETQYTSRMNTDRYYRSDTMIPPILEFSLPQFWNPRTMDYSEAFQVSIFDKMNEELYSWNQTYNKTIITVNGLWSSAVDSGPRVKMSTPATPKKIDVKPTSMVNGEITDYDITITTTNFLQEGDQLVIGLPDPVYFSSESRALGMSSNLRINQTYTVAVDLNKITIDLLLPLSSTFGGRRLQTSTARIPAGEAFTLRLTQIKNPMSLKPTTGSITYASYTQGQLIEQLTGGLQITNEEHGELDPLTTSIRPSDFRQNVATNYTLAFRPVNYIQNLQIQLTLPRQVDFSSNLITCYGIQGTDSKEVKCKGDSKSKKIFVTNAVTFQRGNPGTIQIAFETLLNPAENMVTDSFLLETFSSDGYALDAITTGLQVNFFCEFPCKTCDDDAKDFCLSCYYNDDFPIFYRNKCYDICPAGLYNTETECLECEEPCATCSGYAQNCLTCIDGYWLNSQDQCVKKVYWIFPFFLQAAVAFFVIAVSEIVTKTVSRFKEAWIAMLSLAETQAWLAFVIASLAEFGAKGPFIFGIIALWLTLTMNLFHAYIHSSKMVPVSMQSYKVLHKNYRESTYCLRCVSYGCSFKFSLILVSHLFLVGRLKGDYSPTNWRQFNKFALAWILLPFPIMMCACGYQLFKYGFFSYSGFIAVEVIFISAMMASLLLLDATSALRAIREKDINAVKPGGGARLNLGADYESEDEQTGKKALKKRRLNKLNMEEYGVDEASNYDENSMYKLKQSNMSYANSDTNRQIMMLEELAVQMKDEKEQMRLERERLEREKLNGISHYSSNQTAEQTMRKLEVARDDSPDIYRRYDTNIKSYRESGSPQADRSFNKIESVQKLESLPGRSQFVRERPLLRAESPESDFRASPPPEDKRLRPNDPHSKSYKSPPRQTLKGDMEDYDKAYSEPRVREGVQLNVMMPKPIYGQVNYEREKFSDQSMVQQVTPRAGGDSFIGQHDKEDQSQYGMATDIHRALFSKAEDHPSVFTAEENIVRSRASYAETNIEHGKVATAQLFDQRSNAQQEVESEKREIEENQVFVDGSDAQFKMMSRQSDINTQQLQVQRDNACFSQLTDNRSLQDSQKFLERQAAFIGSGSKPLSRKEGTPMALIKQSDDQAYGHNGRQSGHATPVQEFHQLAGSRGRPDDFSRQMDGDFAQIPNPELGDEKEKDSTKKIDKDQFRQSELYELQINDQRGSQGRMSDADRSGYGTAQEYINIKNRPEFGKEKPPNRKGQHDEAFYDNRQGVYEELSDRRQGNEEYRRPAPPMYDKVGAQMIKQGEMEYLDRNIKPPSPNKGTRVAERADNFNPPVYEDDSGCSESSEGIIDHNPFQTAADFIDQTAQIKKEKTLLKQKSISPPRKEQSPLAQQKKQVIYSDKSESSIDEMMGDTPSNYNIANGRMDGKSLGLKAILLHAQKTKQGELAAILENVKDQEQDPDASKQSPRLQRQRGDEEEERKFVNQIKRQAEEDQDAGWAAINQPIKKGKLQQVFDPSSDEMPAYRKNTKKQVRTNKEFLEAPLSRNVVGKSYQQGAIPLGKEPQKNNFL